MIIPVEALEFLKARPGDYVAFVVEGGELVVRKVDWNFSGKGER